MTHRSTSGAPRATESPGPVVLTRDGIEQRRTELAALRTERRPAVARQLQRAKLFLDPASSSAAVTLAQGELEMVDARIGWLAAQLAAAEVIGDGPTPPAVEPGFPVTVRYEDGTEETLMVVGPQEVDPSRGYVSSESPVGTALLGKSRRRPHRWPWGRCPGADGRQHRQAGRALRYGDDHRSDLAAMMTSYRSPGVKR